MAWTMRRPNPVWEYASRSCDDRSVWSGSSSVELGPSLIRWIMSGDSPEPASVTPTSTRSSTSSLNRQIRAPGPVYRTEFSTRVSTAARRRSALTGTAPTEAWTTRSRSTTTAHRRRTSSSKCAGVGHVVGRAQVEGDGPHEAVGHPGQLVQLLPNRREVLAPLVVGLARHEVVHVAAGDRQRRPQLVRCHPAQPVAGHRASTVGGRQLGGLVDGGVAPTHVVGHHRREDDRRDDLDELDGRQLLAHHPGQHDGGGVHGERHDGEHRASDRPGPEAVEHREREDHGLDGDQLEVGEVEEGQAAAEEDEEPEGEEGPTGPDRHASATQ